MQTNPSDGAIFPMELSSAYTIFILLNPIYPITMKQLSKIQSAIFLLGGVLMVVGAVSFAFKQVYPSLVEVTSWLFLLGTVLFSVIQSMQTYEGKSPTIHRLKRIQNVANILFLFAGISMVDTVYSFTEKWLGNPQLFYSIFYGKWIMVMLAASILELYTTFRISHEMKAE